jgi:hypothetical protein
MKTKIGTYKPATSIRIGMGDLVNLEMVLRRHVTREFKRRNTCPNWSRGLYRMDIKEATKALRTIKQSQLEYSHVD